MTAIPQGIELSTESCDIHGATTRQSNSRPVYTLDSSRKLYNILFRGSIRLQQLKAPWRLYAVGRWVSVAFQDMVDMGRVRRKERKKERRERISVTLEKLSLVVPGMGGDHCK